MKKIFLFLFIILFAPMANASVYRSWSIDTQMKFNVAYLPDYAHFNFAKTKIEKPIFKPYYNFDTKNIELSKLMDLGFDVDVNVAGENPSDDNFYIKLFNFPDNLSEKKIAKEFLNEFFLAYEYDFEDLVSFISNKNNTEVKFSYIAPAKKVFTKEKPIPAFLTASSTKFSDYFLNHIPFYSIYLTPVGCFSGHSDSERAKWSTSGVTGFYDDIISYYKRNFRELKTKDGNYFYFVINSRDNDKISVIKVPKQVSTFDNWHDLPMPQNPKKIFLSSLLLIYSTEYKAVSGKNPAIIPPFDSDDFKNNFLKDKTTVLEVASVVNIK